MPIRQLLLLDWGGLGAVVFFIKVTVVVVVAQDAKTGPIILPLTMSLASDKGGLLLHNERGLLLQRIGRFELEECFYWHSLSQRG